MMKVYTKLESGHTICGEPVEDSIAIAHAIDQNERHPENTCWATLVK